MQKWSERQRRQRGVEQTSRFSDPAYAAQCPWLGTLAPRDHESLVSVDENEPARVVDVTQNKDRNVLKGDLAESVLPCITKNAKFFDRHREREWCGAELCAAQGIMVSPAELNTFGNEFLVELAGNAFDGPTVLVIYICVLIALAKKRRADACDKLLSTLGNAPADQASEEPFGAIDVSTAANGTSPPDSRELEDPAAQNVEDEMLAFGSLL